MVEINNNKKNIILLFIIMIIILFFIYKGFIADSNQYLQDYKKYLISINASKYYFNKIEKNKKKNLDKKKNKELIKVKEILLEIKSIIIQNIIDNQNIMNNLKNINYSDEDEIKEVINNTLYSLKKSNIKEYLIDGIIKRYINNSLN